MGTFFSKSSLALLNLFLVGPTILAMAYSPNKLVLILLGSGVMLTAFANLIGTGGGTSDGKSLEGPKPSPQERTVYPALATSGLKSTDDYADKSVRSSVTQFGPQQSGFGRTFSGLGSGRKF